jgi:hypothetical protein
VAKYHGVAMIAQPLPAAVEEQLMAVEVPALNPRT